MLLFVEFQPLNAGPYIAMSQNIDPFDNSAVAGGEGFMDQCPKNVLFKWKPLFMFGLLCFFSCLRN